MVKIIPSSQVPESTERQERLAMARSTGLLSRPMDAVAAADEFGVDRPVVAAVGDVEYPQESEIARFVGEGAQAVELGPLSAAGGPVVVEFVRNEDQLGGRPVGEVGAVGHGRTDAAPREPVNGRGDFRRSHVAFFARIPDEIPHVAAIRKQFALAIGTSVQWTPSGLVAPWNPPRE